MFPSLVGVLTAMGVEAENGKNWVRADFEDYSLFLELKNGTWLVGKKYSGQRIQDTPQRDVTTAVSAFFKMVNNE